ncbi:MAG TPA: hypothetical protein VK943_05630 [Arenibaculum sp.]|nr:hypothetical protein [Arenibaculum sp.]
MRRNKHDEVVPEIKFRSVHCVYPARDAALQQRSGSFRLPKYGGALATKYDPSRVEGQSGKDPLPITRKFESG